MQTGGLTFTDAVSLASWIAPRLTASLGSVASVVPYGYPAYARICHPVPDGLGGWNSWSEVAAAKGTTAHALMQWHAVLGSSEQPGSRGAVWPGEPTTGNLATHTLHALCAILAAHTATPGDCMFCLWDGYGALHGSASVAIVRSDGEEVHVPPGVDRTVLDGARVRLPGRDYLLLTGPLHCAGDLDWSPLDGHEMRQSPNLFWPSDHAWCVATEIDFDSTLVAGSTGLIEAVLAAADLDSWRVDPDDSLTYDGDVINPLPPRTK